MTKITFIASSQEQLTRDLDRIGVPSHIPDEQIARYRAIQRQRRCDDGKRRKREERDKRIRNNKMGRGKNLSRNTRPYSR